VTVAGVIRWSRCADRPPAGEPGTLSRLRLTCKSGLAYHHGMSGDVYHAIGDPTRRVILDELQERDGQSLFEICTRLAVRHGLGSSRQAVTQHLDVLVAAGLVRVRREGRYRFHDLDTRPLAEISQRWPVRGQDDPHDREEG
jgi:DNA-binding transcriptional ArsR family regulator